MSTLPLAVLPDRAVPWYLFVLYMLTSVKLCRYGAWRAAGAPNPFLSREMKKRVARHERDLRNSSFA